MKENLFTYPVGQSNPCQIKFNTSIFMLKIKNTIRIIFFIFSLNFICLLKMYKNTSNIIAVPQQRFAPGLKLISTCVSVRYKCLDKNVKKFSRTLNVAPSFLEEPAFLMKKICVRNKYYPRYSCGKNRCPSKFQPFFYK